MAVDETQTWEVQACRGEYRGCPYCLVSLAGLQRQVQRAVADSGWESFLRDRCGGRILPHHRLSIALAACPNACTRPQIKDVGLIARVLPARINGECIGCGECERVCDEGAILCMGEVAELQRESCVGCGLCVRACPENAIEHTGLSFRFLAGGKLGRHPVWAREMASRLPGGAVQGAVRDFLDLAIRELRPSERIAEMVTREGVKVASTCADRASE